MKSILNLVIRNYFGGIIKDDDIELQEKIPGFWHIVAEYFTHE